jgi:hypothetical protein
VDLGAPEPRGGFLDAGRSVGLFENERPKTLPAIVNCADAWLRAGAGHTMKAGAVTLDLNL